MVFDQFKGKKFTEEVYEGNSKDESLYSTFQNKEVFGSTERVLQSYGYLTSNENIFVKGFNSTNSLEVEIDDKKLEKELSGNIGFLTNSLNLINRNKNKFSIYNNCCSFKPKLSKDQKYYGRIYVSLWATRKNTFGQKPIYLRLKYNTFVINTGKYMIPFEFLFVSLIFLAIVFSLIFISRNRVMNFFSKTIWLSTFSETSVSDLEEASVTQLEEMIEQNTELYFKRFGLSNNLLVSRQKESCIDDDQKTQENSIKCDDLTKISEKSSCEENSINMDSSKNEENVNNSKDNCSKSYTRFLGVALAELELNKPFRSEENTDATETKDEYIIVKLDSENQQNTSKNSTTNSDTQMTKILTKSILDSCDPLPALTDKTNSLQNISIPHQSPDTDSDDNQYTEENKNNFLREINKNIEQFNITTISEKQDSDSLPRETEVFMEEAIRAFSFTVDPDSLETNNKNVQSNLTE